LTSIPFSLAMHTVIFFTVMVRIHGVAIGTSLESFKAMNWSTLGQHMLTKSKRKHLHGHGIDYTPQIFENTLRHEQTQI